MVKYEICSGKNRSGKTIDYRKRINNITAITRGVFTPEYLDVVYSSSRKIVVVGFIYKAKKYFARMERSSDRFRLDYLQVVNRALGDAHVDGRIYYVGDSQSVCLIFLADEQKKYLRMIYYHFMKSTNTCS